MKRPLSLLVFFCVTMSLQLSAADSVRTGAVASGVAAYEQSNYEVAYRALLPAAEQGDAAAQYYIASMFRFGKGVKRDRQQSVHWYRRAARQGYAPAQLDLGLKYIKGCGVSMDQVQAYKWLDLAAKQGVETAIDARDSLTDRMTASQISEARMLVNRFHAQIETPARLTQVVPFAESIHHPTAIAGPMQD